MTSRGNRPRDHQSFERDRGERGPRSRSPRTRANLDDEVVALRESGHSYSAVARTLGMKRAVDAHAAFIRVIRNKPLEEREAFTKREGERLDQLEVRIRSRDAEQPVKMERHLEALEALRRAIL